MIVTLTIVILTIILIAVSRQRSKYPPGPFPWPFFGNQRYLRRLAQKFGGLQYAFLELSKRYNSGVISLRLGAGDTIAVSDSKLIHEILCDHEEYDGRPWNEFIKLRNMGIKGGITMNDGPNWKKLRAWSVRSLRSVGFAKQEMTEMFMNELTLILEILKDGGVRRIRPAIAPAVINVLWMIITGKRLSEDSSKLQNFLELLERRSRHFDMAGGTLAAFPWIRYIAPEASGYNILVTVNNELKSFLMDIINEHKQRYTKGNESDFIDIFLHEMLMQQGKSTVFTEHNLLGTLTDFFIAGISTTTSTLDIVFLQMANHQDVQRKLHEEIDSVIGRNRLPILKDRVKMPFAEAVLTESQRMWVVTPIIGPRRVLRNTTLGGYTIPKNTTVLLNLLSTNMNPEYFPDPSSFKPERHLNENGAHQPNENIILFGKGKRRCPGEALARTAIFLLFIGVMQNYRLLPLSGKTSVETEISGGLVLSPKPYKVLIVPR